MTDTTNDPAHDAETTPREHTTGGAEARDDVRDDDAPHITVPPDSNIIGGSAPGEAVDIGTASGPSSSGGG